MFKIMNSLMLITVIILGVGVFTNVSNNKKPENEVSVNAPIEEVTESLMLSSIQLNELASSFLGSSVNGLTVGINSDDNLELSFVIDAKLFELMKVEGDFLLEMFNDKVVSCVMSVNDDLAIDTCMIDGLEIPSNLYDSQYTGIKEALEKTLENLGIDDIEISSQALKLKGDISSIMEKLIK